MNEREAVHLVVGADSLVGAALMRRLRKQGEPVVSTTRRPTAAGEDCVYLNLADSPDTWKFPWPVKVATICAAVTKAQACKDDPRGTAAINVDAISNLAGKLATAGAFVIFLSTNQVFDGNTPHQRADAPLSPVTEYGRQKAEVERRLAAYGDSVAIVRFAKILGPQGSLLTNWANSLKNGMAIHPFSDMTVAPIPLSGAVTVLTLVAGLRLPGIHQVSGDEDITYADATRVGAKAVDADPLLVQPITAASAGSYTEPVPAHTTLNMDRLEAEFGLQAPSSRWTIETAFSNSLLLAGG